MNIVSLHAPRLVGDLMAQVPIVVRADAALPEAARLMDLHQVSGLPVVDGAGRLVGVISETDLLRARATEHLWANWAALRIKHLMTSPALTIHRGQPLVFAARKMERHHVSRLVVVADGDEALPIGVLAASDLVRAMSELLGDAAVEPDDLATAPEPARPAALDEPAGD